MKRKEVRLTKDVICNGFIYVLVKGRKSEDRHKGCSEPHFMGFQNWALKSITKLKRCKKKN